MRTNLSAMSITLVLAACKPGGVKQSDELCAKAAAMYDQCESHTGQTGQQWELVIDRFRGLCRAAMTGETKQLLPDGLQIWSSMDDGTRAGLRVQAECTAKAATCVQYAACEK